MTQKGNRYDVIIVGGGHNGLVCACYLAAAGLKVRVLERRDIVGGAAVTEEFHPGFRNSVASYTVGLLHPKVIHDLNLYEHGLSIVERPIANFLPVSDQQFLKTANSVTEMQAEFARLSKHDAEQLPAYYEMLNKQCELLRSTLLETPPNVGGGITDLVQAVKTANRLRKLELKEQRDLLDIFTKSAGDLLDSWFECDAIKALFGFDSVVGNFASPYTPGSAYVLLHHVWGEVNGNHGMWGHARGGMGAITQAIKKEAKNRGVDISTNASVKQISINNNTAQGIVLENGEAISASRIAANVNPKLLYLNMIKQSDLEPDFLQRIKRWKCGSGSFRMNVALSELPDFTCLPGKQMQEHHQAGIIIGPSLSYMDRAYHDARIHGWSQQPIIEMMISSTLDPDLAPAGQHVASLFCQQFSPELADGQSWDDHKQQAADLIIDTIDRYAPNFKKSVVGRMVLSPLDLERKFGLIGGDIFHGAMTLDQLYSARPMLGHGDYRGPIKRLYMCGSGTHPGGGVTGIPGHNAAREIIRDHRRGA